jgi:hypothetical protein
MCAPIFHQHHTIIVIYIFTFAHVLFFLIHERLFFFFISAPNNFKGLLLRSHVLYRLKHYQSSLADVENALKNRPSSYKVRNELLITLPLYDGSIFLLRMSVCVSLARNLYDKQLKSNKFPVLRFG